MAIFITGGTGKTASRLAHLLQEANVPFLIGSRRGEAAAPSGMNAVKFDWLEDSTYENPFKHGFPGGEKISGAYLVAPDGVEDPSPSMNSFIDYAFRKHGVKRYTLLAGSDVEKGGFHVGKVWSHLADDLAAEGIEYAVLRGTWFMGKDTVYSLLPTSFIHFISSQVPSATNLPRLK